MNFNQLYKSVFAILRFEGQNGTVSGTGFVISVNPIKILTCHHVVSDATEHNDGNVKYSITKNSNNGGDFDLRNGGIHFLRVSRITNVPNLDLAILEVDFDENRDIFFELGLGDAPPLELSFNKADRMPGSAVEWLSTAAAGDITLTPRFFKGNLIASYIADNSYSFAAPNGQPTMQLMSGVHLLEVDMLFIPGSSGSPIIDVASNRVIGYVHGFKSWPIPTNTEVQHPFTLTDEQGLRTVNLKYNKPLMASLSLGIDLRAIEGYLNENNVI